MTKQNTPATFYRVCHDISGQGLWYTPRGEFTGLIHGQLDFCSNKDLKMPYDADIVGYLSATKTIDELLTWFPLKDIQRLEDFGFFITEYAASDYEFYKNHWIINQATSIVVRIIPVTELLKTPTEVKEPEESILEVKESKPRFEITESGRQLLKYNSEVRIIDTKNEDFILIVEGADFPKLEAYSETILNILNNVKI